MNHKDVQDVSLTVGIVANEASGDILGASIVREIRRQVPDARFVGVAGPRMLAEGCETLFDMERLSVMGLMEVLGHLRELLGLRRTLVDYFRSNPPDIFIGVDAPDFNLGLERRLRDSGIKTAHLVSPTVWAWRPGRVKGIRRSVDLMLSVFPFEETFLRRHGVPASYVGHPLADEIALEVDQAGARAALGVSGEGPILAILPGSRVGEMQRLAEPFIATAQRCLTERPDLRFLVPCATPRLRAMFADVLARTAPDLPLMLFDGRSREVMAAADCLLTASGTATLEGLLFKRPMVVAYRVHPISYHVVKQLGLVKIPHIAMANLLVGRELAPEFVQSRCRPELLAPAVLAFLEDPLRVTEIRDAYRRVHCDLRRDAAREAAKALLELVAKVNP